MNSPLQNERFNILKIVGIYALISGLWIYFSDTVLSWLVHDPAIMTAISIFKGFFFVVVTSSLLYILIRRHMKRLTEINRALREREAFLQNIAKNVPGVIFQSYASDKGECGMSYISEKAPEIFGLPGDPATFLASFTAQIAPEDRDRFRDSLRDAAADAAPWRFEGRFIRPGGEWMWFQGMSTPQREEDRLLHHGVLLDITERKNAEEALRESEGKFRDLAEKSMVGIYLYQDARFKYVNSEFAETLGYTPEEIIDRLPLSDIIHPEDLPLVEENNRKRLQGEEKARRYEFRARGRDGSIKYVEIYGSRTIYRGKPALIGTALDVTDRRRAEEDLRRLSVAVEQAAENIIITDREGVIQYVNPAFEKITGYSREEAIGQNPRFLKSGVHDSAFYEDLWDTIGGGKVWTGRFTNRRRDGSLYQEDATISPLVTSSGNLMGYVSLKRDVTEAVRLEAHLRQAQKMEAIGTLAGGIAHDFNNILSAMMGYAELAKFKTSDETIQPYMDQILKACNRSRDLVTQILTFSRQREKEKIAVAVTPIVKEALKLLRSSFPATIEIKTSYEAPQGTIFADPTQIHQVLMNLCTNAVYAMREKEAGVLSVHLDRHTLSADDTACNPEMQPGDYLQITVADTGEGIDPAIRENIFDPFFTTKASGEGTGLGLSVVYGIVKDHGGCISVDSEPGTGAVFTVYLPLVEAGERLKGKEPAPVPRGAGRILLVDDEEPLASLGREMLTSLGYDVTVHLSSRNALEAFRAHPERFELVITDMTMPNMTGTTLSREILKIRPGTPIILTTGFSQRIDEEEAMRIGIRKLLMKPVSLKDLARAVKEIVNPEAFSKDG